MKVLVSDQLSEVGVKIFLETPEIISTLLDEARLASRIRHPNVVATLDMVTTDDISKLDHAHFDAAGQIDFGQRLGNAYLELVAVPEPSSGALAGFAVVFGLCYRKRRRS